MAVKEIVVKTLRTSEDFNELLSLSDLKTQMEVLGFLQKNLFEYQMNFFKSQLMTFDEFWNFIPDNDKPKYFQDKEYVSGYKKKDGTLEKGYYKPWDYKYAYKTFKEFYGNKNNYFLFDGKEKKYDIITAAEIKKFKFDYQQGLLICYWTERKQSKEYAQWARCFMRDEEYGTTIKFDLSKNILVSYKSNYKLLSRYDCGSWYSRANSR